MSPFGIHFVTGEIPLVYYITTVLLLSSYQNLSQQKMFSMNYSFHGKRRNAPFLTPVGAFRLGCKNYVYSRKRETIATPQSLFSNVSY